MLGPMGAFVMSVLRVMTPSEIDRYANTIETKKVTAAAAGAEEFDLSDSKTSSWGNEKKDGDAFKAMTDAEIIPIESFQNKRRSSEPSANQLSNEKVETKGEKSPQQLGVESPNSQKELEGIGIFSSEKINAIKKARKEQEEEGEDSSTVFLLRQREKLKRTKSKMIGNNALKTYAKAVNAEMIQAEFDLDDDPEQELAQGSRGILVNKKHY